jgi:penicillin-binding protein 2
VHTGEVLVMASKPAYDLNAFSPRLSVAAAADIEERKAWTNIALNGVYSPGSTFKIVVSTAALLSGAITPGGHARGLRGLHDDRQPPLQLRQRAGHHGILQAPRRHQRELRHLFLHRRAEDLGRRDRGAGAALPPRPADGDRAPGRDPPHADPDPAWKRKRARDEAWTPGDTANMSIGQGDVQVTPLVMACFAASFARGELWTKPTLIHDPNRPPQHTEPIGLSGSQRAAILKGMEECTMEGGTAEVLTTLEALRVPGVRVAGKTGTAQIKRPQGKVDEAWFICFAPLENPEIAIAVAIEGDNPGETSAGGL